MITIEMMIRAYLIYLFACINLMIIGIGTAVVIESRGKRHARN